MTAKRITRREALAAGFGAVAIAGNVTAAPVPKADPNGSWVGKTVLPKKYRTRGAFLLRFQPKPDGTPMEVDVILEAPSYGVKAEKGTRVEVFNPDGRACWVEKAELVPLSESVEFFTKALKDDKKDTFALVSRGWSHYLLGKPESAIADFDEFLKLTPEQGPAEVPGAVVVPLPARWEGLVNRGLVLAEQGEFKKAFADLDEAIGGWTDAAVIAHINRGYAHELKGEYAKALEDYDQACKVKISDTLASNNMAWVWATCPDEKVRNGAQAFKRAWAICEITDNREGMYLDTLAAAYAEAGKFDDAVKAQEKALEDKSYAIRYGEDGQKRLQLYKDKKPFRTAPLKK